MLLLISLVCAQVWVYPEGVIEQFTVRKPASDGCNSCEHLIKCYGPNRTRCIDTGPSVCTLAGCYKKYVPAEDEYFDYNKN